jgi:hypothetical protein
VNVLEDSASSSRDRMLPRRGLDLIGPEYGTDEMGPEYRDKERSVVMKMM